MEETAKFFNDEGAKLASEGFHKEAIAYLKKGLDIEPDNSLIWFNLGLSYYALKQKDESRTAMIYSLYYNPADADAWDSLGVILFEMGDFKNSARAYKEALKLEPYVGRIWNNYGSLLFAVSEYKEACRAFESALSLDSDLPDAVFNLKDTYLELGMKDKAEICAGILKQMNYCEDGEEGAEPEKEAACKKNNL